MKTLIFYEKPGCIGNARQKALLEQEGFVLDVRSLLAMPWTPDTLRPYFGARPVAEWFNRTAPSVKHGDVVPEALDESGALSAMVAEPLLIRRPLLEFEGIKMCGFDNYVQHECLGLRARVSGYEVCQSVPQPPCSPP